MPELPFIAVTKPVSVWNKALKVDFKKLFTALGKAIVSGVIFKNPHHAARSAVEAISALGLKQEPGEIAYLLIFRSLTAAIYQLVGEQEALRNSSRPGPEALIDSLDLALENRELTIDAGFFDHPRKLPLLEWIKIPFRQWLEKGFGLAAAQAQAFANPLPDYFTVTLNTEWTTNPEIYAVLPAKLVSPLSQPAVRAQAWLDYARKLERRPDEPLPGEDFGLRAVYIPLRAYFRQELPAPDEKKGRPFLEKEKPYQRVVVDLEEHLHVWLDQGKPDDALRVVSGEPGGGKSSFARIFAAHQAAAGERRVLFIPLYHFSFDATADLVDAVGRFVQEKGEGFPSLPHNPLDPGADEGRLLLIFDGLDELAQQGRAWEEISRQFVDKVLTLLGIRNQGRTRLQVLITGRVPAIQEHRHRFQKEGQILRLLPYHLTEAEIKLHPYHDPQKILNRDQRQEWWQKYGRVTDAAYPGLPKDLDRDQLRDLTTRPLLNYLLAQIYRQQPQGFAQATSINAVYRQLISAVHERIWEPGRQYPVNQSLRLEEFFRLLEEIAVAAWHGDGRKTTLGQIGERFDKYPPLRELLTRFPEKKSSQAVSRLLTGFWVQQDETPLQAERIYEFTHKSFCEYLVAVNLVGQLRKTHQRRQMYLQGDYDGGWEKRRALDEWAELCGPTALDGDLLPYLREEIRLHAEAQKSEVEGWQATLGDLIGEMLQEGMFGKEPPSYPYKELVRQAGNAELALLAALNACALAIRTRARIKWPEPTAAGVWLARLAGQRGAVPELALRCLSFLDLSGCFLVFRDFFHANLRNANLREADLRGANLRDANLTWANLSGADLCWANLSEADLRPANLREADLGAANLRGGQLREANLSGAHLYEADLTGADLSRADLSEANLIKANLSRANLSGADLSGANLAGANFWGANLSGSNLRRANLMGTDLSGWWVVDLPPRVDGVKVDSNTRMDAKMKELLKQAGVLKE